MPSRVSRSASTRPSSSVMARSAVRSSVRLVERRTPTSSRPCVGRSRSRSTPARSACRPGSSTPLGSTRVLARSRRSSRSPGVAAPLYATHMRNEADGLFEALDEAISATRAAGEGARLQVSHLKAASRSVHGRAAEAVALLASARAEGLDVAADQYPYIAAATTLATILPPETLAQDPAAAAASLRSSASRAEIRATMERGLSGWENVAADPGWNGIVIAYSASRSEWAGRSLAQLGQELGADPADLAFDVLAADDLRTDCVIVCMTEPDVETIMAVPWIAVCTDAEGRRPGHPILGAGVPHPRTYGTTARVLGRYVRERGVVSLETAIAKMTSVPAERIGLSDRGIVREGRRRRPRRPRPGDRHRHRDLRVAGPAPHRHRRRRRQRHPRRPRRRRDGRSSRPAAAPMNGGEPRVAEARWRARSPTPFDTRPDRVASGSRSTPSVACSSPSHRRHVVAGPTPSRGSRPSSSSARRGSADTSTGRRSDEPMSPPVVRSGTAPSSASPAIHIDWRSCRLRRRATLGRRTTGPAGWPRSPRPPRAVGPSSPAGGAARLVPRPGSRGHRARRRGERRGPRRRPDGGLVARILGLAGGARRGPAGCRSRGGSSSRRARPSRRSSSTSLPTCGSSATALASGPSSLVVDLIMHSGVAGFASTRQSSTARSPTRPRDQSPRSAGPVDSSGTTRTSSAHRSHRHS